MKVIFLDHDGVICLSNNWGGRTKKWKKYRSENPEGSDEKKNAPVEYRFDDFDKKAIKALNENYMQLLKNLVITMKVRESSNDQLR